MGHTKAGGNLDLAQGHNLPTPAVEDHALFFTFSCMFDSSFLESLQK